MQETDRDGFHLVLFETLAGSDHLILVERFVDVAVSDHPLCYFQDAAAWH